MKNNVNFYLSVLLVALPVLLPSALQAAPRPELVPIPAGEFVMGCQEGRDDIGYTCNFDEKPAHTVKINAFRLARTEVSIEQFQVFVEATAYMTTAEQQGTCWVVGSEMGWQEEPKRSWRDPGFVQTPQDPVVCVSWDDAMAYVKWLNENGDDKTVYRLPTEAEWEYAARAGGDSAYPWGTEVADICRYTNLADHSAAKVYTDWSVVNCDDSYVNTAPVGSLLPNQFGLYDMQGNVWEWLSDWKGNYTADKQVDPAGAATGVARILRGGSWNSRIHNLRSAKRLCNAPTYRHSQFGFRVAAGL